MQNLSPIIFTEATHFVVPEFVYLPNPFFLVILINGPIETVFWAVQHGKFRPRESSTKQGNVFY